MIKIQEGFNNEFVAAARDGDLQKVLAHIDQGVSPDTPNMAGARAVERAAENGHEEIVACLLDRGASPNFKGKDGRLESSTQKTALMYAATKGHLQILRRLIRAGADLDLQDAGGQTALIWASAYNQFEAVRELVVAGAETSIRDENGNTALDLAREYGTEHLVGLLAESAGH